MKPLLAGVFVILFLVAVVIILVQLSDHELSDAMFQRELNMFTNLFLVLPAFAFLLLGYYVEGAWMLLTMITSMCYHMQETRAWLYVDVPCL